MVYTVQDFTKKPKKLGEGISVFLPGKIFKVFILDSSPITVKVVFPAKEKLVCQNDTHALS